MFSALSKLIGNRPLLLTIPASLAIHTGVYYHLDFDYLDFNKPPPSPTFDVTITAKKDDQAPENPDFIANNDQLGSGSKEEKSRLKSKFAAMEQRLATGKDEVTAEKRVSTVIPKPTPQILSTKGKTAKSVDKLPEETPPEEPSTHTNDNSEQADAIAKLMAEMSAKEEAFARRPRVHFIDSLSARGAVEADYIHRWSQKLERIGNINFPKEAIELSLSGTLIVNTTLDRKGRIIEIEISVSSGSKILDKAATRIIKLAAPFDPLPAEVLEKYDRLNITRTLVFHKGQEQEGKFSSK